MTTQRLCFVLKGDRLACEGNVPVDLEPVRFVIGSQVAHQFPLRVAQPGLLFKGRIDFQETVIDAEACRRGQISFQSCKTLRSASQTGHAIPRFRLAGLMAFGRIGVLVQRKVRRPGLPVRPHLVTCRTLFHYSSISDSDCSRLS